mgnify:CR=1 FL=1|tara:strand:- start:88 stop:1224 length:1137 start_codon:yes stop_codon:yes gene_type:complete
MKKLILILLAVISLQVNAQDKDNTVGNLFQNKYVKDLLKFGTVYGAVNGGTSLSDEDVYSVTDGLETSLVETPYDYSVLFGIRKIKKFGYEDKERFKNGTENSFTDAATIGRWTNKIEFLFQGEYKRQQGESYLDQHHFIRYVASDGCDKGLHISKLGKCLKHYIVKVEYLEDGFADIKYFEASERFTYKHPKFKNVTFNFGAAHRLAEPYGYDPLAEWVLSNGNLHYTQLAIEQGYQIEFSRDGIEYFNPSGNSVATSTEVWEAVVIPDVIADYTEKKRGELQNTIQHSLVLGFDYYKYEKKSWTHLWGSIMPWHYDAGDEFSYHKFIGGQWYDYSFGVVYGHWYNKNLGVFVEGTYNKYWNREWHGFSAGVNYRVF